MAIYRYSHNAIIDDIEILKNEKGGVRAYIHARNEAAPEHIQGLMNSFAAHGWFGVPMQYKNRAVLELRGFKSPEELLHFVQTNNIVQGAPQVEITPDDHQGFWDKFKAATLKYSGWAYIGGDIAFMTYAGMEQYKHYEKMRRAKSMVGSAEEIAHAVKQAEEGISGGKFKIASGLGYAAGSLVLAGYGSRDQSHIEIQKSVEKIERFLKTEGLASPNAEEILTQEPQKKNKGILGSINDVLRRFPSEALNVIYIGVGLALARASIKQVGKLSAELKPAKAAFDEAKRIGKAGEELEDISDAYKSIKKERRSESIDIGLGATTALATFAGIVIKEKRPVEGQKKREGLAGVWDWVQEKPLRVTGYGLMLSTLFHTVATVDKWSPTHSEKKVLGKLSRGETLTKEAETILKDFKFRHKTLIGRGVFIAANVLAEVLMVLSSKGHGEGVRNADVDESVVATTAEYIAKQNPATQDQLIERLAGYMSAPDVLAMKAEVIAENLRTQVAALKANPWAHGVAQSNVHHSAVGADVAASPEIPSTRVQSVQRMAGLQALSERKEHVPTQSWKEHATESKQLAAGQLASV